MNNEKRTGFNTLLLPWLLVLCPMTAAVKYYLYLTYTLSMLLAFCFGILMMSVALKPSQYSTNANI